MKAADLLAEKAIQGDQAKAWKWTFANVSQCKIVLSYRPWQQQMPTSHSFSALINKDILEDEIKNTPLR